MASTAMPQGKQPKAQSSIKAFFKKGAAPKPAEAKPAADQAPASENSHEVSASDKQQTAPVARKGVPLSSPKGLHETCNAPTKGAEGEQSKPSVPTEPTVVTLSPGQAADDAHQDKGSKPDQAPAVEGPAVGCSIWVFWPDEKQWFAGAVSACTGRKHQVQYEDGDEEWLDLGKEKFSLSCPPESKAPPRKAKQVLLSDSEPEEGEASMGEESGSEFGSQNAAAGAASDDAEASDLEAEIDDVQEVSPPSRKRPAQAKPTPAAKKARTDAAKTPASAGAKTLGSAGAKTPAASSAKAASAVKTTAPRPSSASGAAARTAATPSSLADAFGPEAAGAANSAKNYTAFPFLQPGKLRDAAGVLEGCPGYNPRTLKIPASWFKDAKVSPGQQQWWTFKAQHFDSVMLFKMGKFYEMFNMDAHVGADVLGLSYMKGEQAHCGFPEANYHTNAERLARAGLRVVVVEQTETPDLLKIRNEGLKKAGKKQSTVVNRELVAVLTKSTLSDPDMLHTHPQAQQLLALVELPGSCHGSCTIGACAVDVASGHMQIGQWQDDVMRTRLRSLLASLQPAEVVLRKAGDGHDDEGVLSGTTLKVLKSGTRQARMNWLSTTWGDAAPDKADQMLRSYFEGGIQPAPLLAELLGAESSMDDAAEGTGSQRAALWAVGSCLSHLKSLLADRAVMAMCRVERLPQSCEGAAPQPEASQQQPALLALDGNALANLEVLESTEGDPKGGLAASMDHCVTAAGRRKLRAWLCQPLACPQAIRARQDAVQDLMEGCCDAAGAARRQFAGVGDLERAVARIAATCADAVARDADAVVLYENAAKRRVQAFVAALKSLQALQAALQGLAEESGSMQSSLLRSLVTPGEGFPDPTGPLQKLLAAADWDAAADEGRIRPCRGTSEAVDAAEDAIAAANSELQEYLARVAGQLGGQGKISYVALHKDSHVLEVPQELEKKVPSSFERLAHRKGFVRYMSPELRQLAGSMSEAKQDLEVALSGVLKALLRQFLEHREVWAGCVEALAQVDALASLAVAATAASAHGPICRPVFLDPAVAGPNAFRAKELRHPAAGGAAALSSGSFIANDVSLGGDQPPFMLLTGPNMGGKSTMLRQVCLAALIAQVGGWAPAASLELSPVDAIFVRSGARDAIMSGQSTFFVELAETAAALQRATPASLIALDELGRGTGTSDGAAIAAAVLEHLSHKTACRGMFATHYHKLADSHTDSPHVALKHMACQVEQGADGTQQVAFLYRLAEGACPKSYGTSVAHLAGLPAKLVQQAARLAEQLESHQASGGSTLAQAMQQICKSDQQTESSQQQPTQSMASKHAAMLQRISHALQSSQQDQALAVLVQLQADAKALLTR